MKISALSWTSFAAALALTLPASAQDSPVAFTGSVALASDYTFRGISQTFEDPAVQGGITGAAGPAYLGLWGSNVDFGEAAPADRGTAEVDIFGGLKFELGTIASLDLGGIYYAYPGTGDTYEYDFWEVGLGLSRPISVVTTGVKVGYSPDFFLSSGKALYLGGSLGFGIPSTPVSLAATLGKQSIDDNAAFGTPDYMDYSVGATLSALGVGIGAALVGTDLEDSECFGGTDLCKPRVIFSLTRGM